MLLNAMMVILLQYINVSNRHIINLKLTQRYMPTISQLKNMHQERGKGSKRTERQRQRHIKRETLNRAIENKRCSSCHRD